jgi:hypothetical protein
VTTTAKELVDALTGGFQRILLDRHPPDRSAPPRAWDELFLDIDLVDEGAIRLRLGQETRGSAHPSDVWHGIVRRYPLASAHDGLLTYTREEVIPVVERLLPLAKRVLEGGAVEWNGHHHVGVLNEDAQQAHVQLEEAARLPDSSITTWSADEWLREIDPDVWPDGVTLDDAAKAIQDEIDGLDDVEVVGDIKKALLSVADAAAFRGETLDEIKVRALFEAGMIDKDQAIEILYPEDDEAY